MPRTIETIIEAHRAARERMAAGKPVWEYQINVKGWLSTLSAKPTNEEYAACARAIGAEVRSRLPDDFFDIGSDRYCQDIVDFVEEFVGMTPGSAGDDPEYTMEEHFNGWLDTFYDCADRLRIWVTNKPVMRVQDAAEMEKTAAPAP